MRVHRVDFGYFVRPPAETGTGSPRAEPVLGYLIDHPDGALLVDTGMGEDPWVDGHYRPHRIPLPAALSAAGTTPDDVRYVINGHLHFDHCGGNPQLPGRPIFTQRTELAAARHEPDFTIPELIDHPGAVYEELPPEPTEIRPGVFILPTPGHTAGHQSVVVRRTDGVLIVAGQSHDNASLFTADAQAHRAGINNPPPWVAQLLAFDPRQILFAHDNAVWTP